MLCNGTVLLRNNLSQRPRLICVCLVSRLRTVGVRLASGSVTDAKPNFLIVKRRYHHGITFIEVLDLALLSNKRRALKYSSLPNKRRTFTYIAAELVCIVHNQGCQVHWAKINQTHVVQNKPKKDKL